MGFLERLRLRGEGKERLVPWHLHDKLRFYEFCTTVGLPTPGLLRSHEHPSAIDLSGLPDQFVVKPAYESSSRGVMVLTRTRDGYLERMRGRLVTAEEVRSAQQDVYDASSKTLKWTMVEEKVSEAGEFPIPRDFKAYCFQGEIAFIAELDRNGKRTSAAWYDGEFEPLSEGAVETRSRYLDRKDHSRPAEWQEMLRLAQRASVVIPSPFVSIDMFASTRGPLIGEVTLVPGGFYFGEYFSPSAEMNTLAGDMWTRAITRLGRDEIEPTAALSSR